MKKWLLTIWGVCLAASAIAAPNMYVLATTNPAPAGLLGAHSTMHEVGGNDPISPMPAHTVAGMITLTNQTAQPTTPVASAGVYGSNGCVIAINSSGQTYNLSRNIGFRACLVACESSAGVNKLCQLSFETWDTENAFNNATNTYTYTVPRTGKWLLGAMGYSQSYTDQDHASLYIQSVYGIKTNRILYAQGIAARTSDWLYINNCVQRILTNGCVLTMWINNGTAAAKWYGPATSNDDEPGGLTTMWGVYLDQ